MSVGKRDPWKTSRGTMVAHCHDDVIKWKHFPRYWPFVRGIHRSPVNSPHKGKWRGTLNCVFFDLRQNIRLSKWRGWWFETPSRPLWRHRDAPPWFSTRGVFSSRPILVTSHGVGDHDQHWIRCLFGTWSNYMKQHWLVINLTLRNNLWWNVNLNAKHFHSRKCIWRYGMQSVGRFVQASVCLIGLIPH